MDYLSTRFADYLDYAKSVVLLPTSPSSRIFALYLLTSALFALFVYLRMRATDRARYGSFVKFLFPASVWRHPSAWLDVRYFFFHQLIGHFLLLSVGIASSVATFQLLTGLGSYDQATASATLTGWKGAALASGFMIVSFVLSDFIGFLMHYLQHKVPFLWQFHKVHHSAEVMHPLSNFREHPMDNLVYMVTIGLGYGAVTAASVHVVGYIPAIPLLMGAPVLMFLFNVTGYNLRHSHVWLRWPGVWSKVFPSPAHHHVHHSCHPDHLDKNFAFMLPVWDVIFGCYVMPEDNRDVKFGVTEKDKGHELNSCMKLYFVPVRDAWRVLTRPTAKGGPAAAANDPVAKPQAGAGAQV